MPQRSNTVFTIYRNGSPDAQLELLGCGESAGADRLDTALLEFRGGTIEDLDPLDPGGIFLNQEIEIVQVATGAVIHWGKTGILPPVISASAGESLHMTSRTELFHMGGKVDGYWVWDPTLGTPGPVKVDGDLVFNPMIDGTIYGNLNDTQLTSAGDPLFLDPESVRTSAAITLQGAELDYWSLAGAVYYLLWSLNTAQTYVTNATLVALQAIFNDPTALVQDVRIPRGTYLAHALDLLLVPLGYLWRVKRTALGAREFAFWKRGTGGSLVWVNHQRMNTTLNLAETNVDTAALNFDIARLANEITVRGGFGEYEITVELARGWETADDPVAGAGDEYAKDHVDFDDVRDVMRRWVLNEAGDYIGLRAEITGVFTSALRTSFTALGILDEFVPRRRRLLPTLTLGPEGAPIGRQHGVEIEWSNTSPAEWKPVGPWGPQLLDHEAGIYFDCDRLPEEFLSDPANTRIRVTATIQNDYRLTGYVARQADSPQEDIIPLVLDLPDRFRYRVRHSSLSKYGGGALPSLVQDDSTAIQDFSAFARNVWDLMDVSGAIQLEGLNHTYIVGDRVQGIQHKNILFEARDSSGAYPQIVAIERDIGTQTMTLHLERQRELLQLPLPQRGNTPRFGIRATARDTL